MKVKRGSLMIEKICPKCKIPMSGDKCIKPSCQAKTEVSTTIYWCEECNVPIFEPICPRCGKEGKYIATDVRPVFPEEQLLLALIKGKKEPHCYEKSSVWYGSGAYIINGKKEKLAINTINKWPLDKIRDIKEQYDVLISTIDMKYFKNYQKKVDDDQSVLQYFD